MIHIFNLFDDLPILSSAFVEDEDSYMVITASRKITFWDIEKGLEIFNIINDDNKDKDKDNEDEDDDDDDDGNFPSYFCSLVITQDDTIISSTSDGKIIIKNFSFRRFYNKEYILSTNSTEMITISHNKKILISYTLFTRWSQIKVWNIEELYL